MKLVLQEWPRYLEYKSLGQVGVDSVSAKEMTDVKDSIQTTVTSFQLIIKIICNTKMI